VVGVALSGVGAALNRSGTIDVRRGMALNPISARRAVVAAAVAMRRRISDLPATGVGSAVAVAYWTSVMHGRFGVREVAGGWPGRVAGNAAVVVGAMAVTSLRPQRNSRRTGIPIRRRMTSPRLQVKGSIGTPVPSTRPASCPVPQGWSGP
jgi:hypothetical protein